MKVLISIKVAIAVILSSLSTEKSRESIWQEINNHNILFPDIVMQKAIQETECGTTGVGASRDNIFGFRVKEYINFKDSIGSWKACIRYYKNWQDKKYPIHLEKYHKTSKCDYYCFIESIGWKSGKPYSEGEKRYTQVLRKIKINF